MIRALGWLLALIQAVLGACVSDVNAIINGRMKSKSNAIKIQTNASTAKNRPAKRRRAITAPAMAASQVNGPKYDVFAAS